jgi:iron complex outermembrane receptor protein
MASVGAFAEADMTRWLSARLLVREILHNNKFLTPDFSASAEIRPFPEKNYLIKAGFSKNSKIPALNDMYWSPGGNPELENETGYSSEITWEMTGLLSESVRIKNDITFFGNFISNMIQWHPGDFSYWEADNISNLRTAGIEAGINVIYTGSALRAVLNTEYSLTKAIYAGFVNDNTSSAGKQLAYVPVNQINALLRISWKQLYSIFNTTYIGKRFLTADNSQYLPHYSVSDLNLGIRLSGGTTGYDIGFTIENILNINYQNIAYYPMPGRSYMFSLAFQLKK